MNDESRQFADEVPKKPKNPNLTGGSRKGIPNKLPTELKDIIRKALDNAGGVNYLTKQADENPVAFMALLGKIIPRNVSVSGVDGKPVQIQRIERVIVNPGNDS